jgi:hypothetical protein
MARGHGDARPGQSAGSHLPRVRCRRSFLRSPDAGHRHRHAPWRLLALSWDDFVLAGRSITLRHTLTKQQDDREAELLPDEQTMLIRGTR